LGDDFTGPGYGAVVTIRLIATDLDGTLLADPTSISERNRAALDAARAMGIEVVPVTARQPRALRPIAELAGFAGWALCGNGGHGLHLTTGELLFEAHLEAATGQALAAALLRTLPETMFASVREGGEVFVAQDAYARSATFSDHKREPADMVVAPLADVLAEPSLKLIVRHAELGNDDLVARIRSLGLDGFELTHSGAPFVEVLAPGVSKAWGCSSCARAWASTLRRCLPSVMHPTTPRCSPGPGGVWRWRTPPRSRWLPRTRSLSATSTTASPR